MTNKERILSVLQDAGTPLCDTCLTTMARISTRQVAYMVANELRARRLTERETGSCEGCGKTVLCSRIVQTPGFVLPRSSVPERKQRVTTLRPATPEAPLSLIDPDQAWYWEGNVRAVAAQWLEAQGWRVVHMSDTAARSAEVDIVARQPPRKELWATVKGFPEESRNVQARHWFAGAIFDLVTYRDRSSELYLAVALPDGYATYAGLAARSGWLKKAMPFTFLWVAKDGTVRSD